MIVYGKGILWDELENKRLCKFNSGGELETHDPEKIRKLMELGLPMVPQTDSDEMFLQPSAPMPEGTEIPPEILEALPDGLQPTTDHIVSEAEAAKELPEPEKKPAPAKKPRTRKPVAK